MESEPQNLWVAGIDFPVSTFLPDSPVPSDELTVVGLFKEPSMVEETKSVAALM